MLKIFNDMKVFFEDCYRNVNVREYARIMKISPPTASKILKEYEKEGLLKSKEDRNYIIYRANRENPLFLDLSRAYWRQRLEPLIKVLSEEINFNSIILFGSLVKGEATKNSDIDIYLDMKKKEIDLKRFEKSLKRKVQLHFNVKDKKLLNNIRKGVVLYGLG